jgi:D-lactate dehydrogenase (cytochrome)
MIIKTDESIMQSYLADESGLSGGHAHTVYIPENEKELIDLVKDLAKKKVHITVSGAGTGVVGGRVPFGGCIISLEKLKKVFEIKKVSDTEAVVSSQAGTTVKEIKEFAGRRGWMYPPDPTEQNSSLGGNIATNASGSRGFKFGATRKYIKSLKIVLSNGDVLDIKRGQ